MSVEHERLKEILSEATGKDTPEARAAYLEAACQGNVALRRQVEALLAAHARAGDFLEQSVIPPAEAPIGEGPGTRIGRYKLLEEIGAGGFGLVFMAEQTEPVNRKVALKIIKAGMDTREVIARFEAERQALALMDHPNIARVLDAGATETGRPYFVMELVRGMSITDYCDQKQLPTAERLQLFMKVCAAVQHAHQKGIIHRDLKPTNILVTVIDGGAVPKVIDFGVAKALGQKLTEKTLFTSFQQMIGTPAYMSPEQAELSGVDVDTRSDIYSLGVLLYELLTGVTPFDADTLRKAALDEIRRLIRETEPPKPSTRLRQALVAADVRRLKSSSSQPSTLNAQPADGASSRRLLQIKETIRLVRGDLDWIVMKALEKDRARRYGTASALAEDLQHHLNHEPVQASPPSAAYRAQKFIRRHRFGVAMATTVTLALAVGLTAALLGFEEARRERDRAELLAKQEATQRQRAEADEKKALAEASKSQQVARFLEDMLQGVDPWLAAGRDTTLLREILDRTAQRLEIELKGQPEVLAELLVTLAKTYLGLEEYAKTEVNCRKALRLFESVQAKPRIAAADCKTWLGVALLERDQPGEGIHFIRQAVEMKKAILGEEHPEVVFALKTLGGALCRHGDWVEANAVLRETFSLAERLGISRSQRFVGVRASLALVRANHGDLVEAEALVREDISLERSFQGTDTPTAAMEMGVLARILQQRGDLPGAETTLRQTLVLYRKLQLDQGKWYGETLESLGSVLMHRGNLNAAKDALEEALRLKTRLLGANHTSTIQTRSSLAQCLRRLGRPAEAEALLPK